MNLRLSVICLICICCSLTLGCSQSENTSKAKLKVKSETTPPQTDNHQPSELPLQLEQMPKEKLDFIASMHETDTSTYLIETRPVVFQIIQVGDNVEEHRGPCTLSRPVEVLIYSLGEAVDGELVDYSWIENTDSGEVFWKMEYDKTQAAGGDLRNRKALQKVTIPKGRYTLKYVSNSENSHAGWTGDPPERPFYHGITVYNLKAIEMIEKKWSEYTNREK